MRTAIIDDHEIFRKGLRMLLSNISGVVVEDEYSSGKEFLVAMQFKNWDIVFMDIKMPDKDGIETAEEALTIKPDLKIVILTTFDSSEYFNTMTEIGVRGYLLKNADKTEIERAIRTVSSGYKYFSHEILIKLSQKISVLEKEKEAKLSFSKDEMMLMEYLSKGMTNQQIANKMNYSPRTIESKRSRLLEKTGNANSVSLIVYAIKHNLIKI